MKVERLLFSGLMILALLALASGVSQAAPPAQGPDTAPSVAGGAGLWAQNCQPCHGPAGQGDGPSASGIPQPLPNFADPQAARQLVPAKNFEVIKNGRIDKLMPPWGNRLSEAQMWDLAAYVWNLSTTSQALAAGQSLYAEQCAACHGEKGAGDGPQAPAQMVDFTDWQAMAGRSQADLQAAFKAGPQHAAFSSLSDDQVWQVLDYIRTFSFKVPERNGVITGQVINATTNQPVGNVEVTLYGFQGQSQVEKLTTQADGEGRYTFKNVATDHAITYMAQGNYKDVTYVSDSPALFVPDSNETTLDLKVYDTTTSDAAVNVTQLHYLISFMPGALNVAEVFVVGNNGNESYVGQNGQTFTFSLPANAAEVNFPNDPDGTRFIQTESGYTDTEPIVPGPQGSSVVAVYTIPFEGDTVNIDVPIPASVKSMNVLMEDRGAKLSSDQLQFAETRPVQGDTFAIYNGSDLKKGQAVSLKLSGLSSLNFSAPAGGENVAAAPAAVAPVDQNLLRWIVLGLGGILVVVAVVVYPRLRPQLTHQPGLYPADPETRRQQLLLLLARLDQAYEAGELDEEVYRQARAKHKLELAGLMQD